MIACLQAYDGWSAVSFVAGEVKNPEKTLLRALAIGMSAAIVIYVAVNVAYLRVLTIPEIAHSDRVGAVTAEHTLGHAGATLVSITILISILGALNGRLMTQPRVYFAQALDGLFFARFATVHPVYRTPSFSIAMQALWSAVLIVTGSFEALVDYRIFGIWMLILNPSLLHEGFMHVKLTMVVLMQIVHALCARARRQFDRNRNTHSARFYRILNEVPAVLIAIIVIMIIVRPHIG